jgi:DNA-binding HxlR family transcriptional regulator
MSIFDYQQIDDVIHSRIRLAIMAALIATEEIEFTALRSLTKATDGNLSANLKKLEETGYVLVKKEFINRKPVSSYSLTIEGKNAFSAYIENLERLIRK